MTISADETTTILYTAQKTRVISDLETYGPIILLAIILLIFIIASIIGSKRMHQQNTLFEHSHFDKTPVNGIKESVVEGVVITDGETGITKTIQI
uniref:Flagellar biosynthesis protein, FliO n=1 Tax=Strongyloides venezuelensis TaxID=75913 RepID=A0A0K0FXU1_STRVS